jgi:hypothetical protein
VATVDIREARNARRAYHVLLTIQRDLPVPAPEDLAEVIESLRSALGDDPRPRQALFRPDPPIRPVIEHIHEHGQGAHGADSVPGCAWCGPKAEGGA